MLVLNKGRTFIKYMEKTLFYLASISIALSTIIICWEVFTRYVLHFSSAISAETAKYLVICSAFLIAGPMTWSDEHISFNFLSRRLKGLPLKIVTLLTILVGLIVSIYVFIFSLDLTLMLKEWGQTSESAEIQMWWINSFMVAGMGLVACYYIGLLIRWFVSALRKEVKGA